MYGVWLLLKLKVISTGVRSDRYQPRNARALRNTFRASTHSSVSSECGEIEKKNWRFYYINELNCEQRREMSSVDRSCWLLRASVPIPRLSLSLSCMFFVLCEVIFRDSTIDGSFNHFSVVVVVDAAALPRSIMTMKRQNP
jgi:hypothetical protein